MESFSATEAAQKVSMLQQSSPSQGIMRTYYTASAVRIDFLNSRLRLIWKAPRWQATFIGEQQKKYWQGEPSQFRTNMSDGMALFRPSDPSNLRSTTFTRSSSMGLPCRVYKLEPKQGLNKGEKKIGEDARLWQRLMPVGGTITVLDKPTYPQAVTKSMAQAMSVVAADGLPLSMVKVKADGKSDPELRLLLSKEVVVEDHFFDLPPGLKQVKTSKDVTTSAEFNEGFAELIK